MVSYHVFIEKLADWFMQLFLDPGYLNDMGTEASNSHVITNTKKIIIGFKKPLLELINVMKANGIAVHESVAGCYQSLSLVTEILEKRLRRQAIMAQWLY